MVVGPLSTGIVNDNGQSSSSNVLITLNAECSKLASRRRCLLVGCLVGWWRRGKSISGSVFKNFLAVDRHKAGAETVEDGTLYYNVLPRLLGRCILICENGVIIAHIWVVLYINT